jgi:hypothetical protein
MSLLRQVALIWSILPAFASDPALIASLSGRVTGVAGKEKRAVVSRLDWLPAGTVLRTDAQSRVTVLWSNGRRFELGPAARATIGPTGPSGITGPVHELAPLPPIPKPAPLELATDAVAVTRFRGGAKIAELCPGQGTAALAGSVKLSFAKVSGADAYQIVLENEDGDRLLDARTASTEIATPALQPGSHYSWRVRAFDAAGVMAEDRVSFVTLSEAEAKARQAFADGLRKTMEPSAALALLAEVDLESGLVREAIDGFHAALELEPQDAAIQRNLVRAQSALAGK